MRVPVVCVLLVASSACMPPTATPGSPTPADIPRLEAAVERDARDVAALVGLGVAYRAAGRTGDATARLEQAIALRPDDPAATLYLGLTYEETGDAARARTLYERYLEIGGTAAVARQVRQRLDLLARQELVARARQLARDEQTGVTGPPEPHTVAVFPFMYTGSDPQYRPLERAIAELVVTDLAQTSRLTVLERLQVQALLDELGLAAAGMTDPATAARSGRLLRAERVVQGSIAIEPSELSLSAAIVGATGEAVRTDPVTAESLQRLFDAQKQLAFALYTSLGVELTVAERARIEQRPTTNIQALLAYGEGLEAEDRGDFEAAAAHYARAAQLDPGFTVAAERGVRTTSMLEAQTAGTAGVADQMALELQATSGVPQPAPPPPPPLSALSDLTADPMRRDAVAEALNLDGIALRTVIRIVFRR